MALDFAPPRYAQLVTAIQDRITSGAYPPGSLMPTEAALTAEFGVSRATVVRALQLLKADGWIESHQGRGTYVRSQPVTADPLRRGADLLTAVERVGSGSEVLRVGPAAVPADVASALAVSPGTQAVVRERLVTVDGEPVELVAAWFPVALAEGTDVASQEKLGEGLAEHLRRRKGVRLARVTERVTARMPTAQEAATLGVPRRVPVLDLLVTAYDGEGRPVQVVTVVLPADRHELEDSYAL